MPEEYLDIVDENGNLTGEKELRSVVHAKGLWHRIANIFFYRKQGTEIDFLIHLRSQEKACNPGAWDPKFGGHVKAGQLLEDALIEETKEESGLKITLDELIKGTQHIYNGNKNKEIIYAYYYNFNDSVETLSFDDGEVQKVKWMNADDIIKAIFKHPKKWNEELSSFKNTYNDLRKKLK